MAVPWPAPATAAVLVAAGAFALGLGLAARAGPKSALELALIDGSYQALLGLAALICLTQAARRRRERAAWLAVGVGLSSWFVGDLAYWLWEGSATFQGVAYLGFYAGATVGVALLVRSAGWRPAEFTDLAIAMAAVGALWAWLVWPHITHDGPPASGLELVYPIADLVLTVVGLGLLQSVGWRPALRWLLITGGFLTIAVVDSVYLVQATHGSYVSGSPLDLLWPAGAIAISAAAWLTVPPQPAKQTQSFSVVLVALAVVFALVLLVIDHFDRLENLALILAAVTIGVGVIRGLATHVSRLRAESSLRAEATRTVQALAAAVDAKDHYTRYHSDNVAATARLIGDRMGLAPSTVRRLEVAGQLHDVGKIAVPDAILLKDGPLDDREFAVMKGHAAEGERIVRSVGLDQIAPWIRHHHERWDGRGYPDGLAGEEAPLEARILAAADALDAMTTTRAYHRGLSADQAREEIAGNAAGQFDPAVATVVAALIDDRSLPVATRREPANA